MVVQGQHERQVEDAGAVGQRQLPPLSRTNTGQPSAASCRRRRGSGQTGVLAGDDEAWGPPARGEGAGQAVMGTPAASAAPWPGSDPACGWRAAGQQGIGHGGILRAEAAQHKIPVAANKVKPRTAGLYLFMKDGGVSGLGQRLGSSRFSRMAVGAAGGDAVESTLPGEPGRCCSTSGTWAT